jgi:hypothetical protein
VSYCTEPCLSAKVGSRAVMCPVVPDPASLIGRAPAPLCLQWLRTLPPCREGSDALRVLRLRILPPYWEGFDAATHPTVPCGPWASNIKKSLACLPMQLGSHVPNARTHVSKAHDIRAIMTRQDVRAGCAINACKTYE